MVGEAAALVGTDVAVLRRELALRILLQNVLLIVSLILATVFAAIAIILPEGAWLAAAAHGAIGLGAVLQWCHHGIRTKQIKAYLLTLDPEGSGGGWELWLPANRPNSWLGSRWMISTKGVFLGLQLALMLLAGLQGPSLEPLLAGASAGLLLTSAAFLLTNPKE